MPEAGNLRRLTLVGVGWTSMAQVVRQALQFAISVILVRLLTPEDFGLMGMIIVFTGFVSLVGESGFGAALIQREVLEERHYSSIFWLNIVMGFALTGLTIIAAPFIGVFFGEPRLVTLIAGIAVNFSVNPLSTVPSAILNRRMDFRIVGFVEVISLLAAGGLAIVLALMGYGVWSLAWQLLASSGVTAAALWLLTGWRPKWLFDRTAVAELLGFSGSLLGFNAYNYWARNADNLLIGRYMGTAELGIYTRAYTTMLLPLSQVTSVLTRVMFPVLARVQNDRMRAREIYLRSLTMIALITFPMMLGLLVVSEHFVLAFFGPKWTAAVPILQVLSLVGMIQSLVTTTGWIFQSQGRTDLMFKWILLAGTVAAGSFVIGVHIGTLEAVAICYAVANALLLYGNFTIPGRLIGLTFLDVVRNVASVFVCSAVMAAIVSVVGMILPLSWPAWAYLLTQVPLGVIVFWCSVHVLRVEAYQEVCEFVSEQVLPRVWQLCGRCATSPGTDRL